VKAKLVWQASCPS